MPWQSSLKALQQQGVGKDLAYLKTWESAVTTSWGVDWDEVYIARDLLQNFFDANRDRLREVRVTVDGATVTIAAPQAFPLERLFYLGSEKDEEAIGQYGEGFKVAVTCLIRDHNIAPIAVSGPHVLYIRAADTTVVQTTLQPIVYDFFQSAEAYAGAQLILRGCSTKLVRALATGMTHFLYEGNPLLGGCLWASQEAQFALYASTTATGHIFYRRLKRGEIPDIPVVLVINKSYAVIEKLIQKDRDRNAFGETLLQKFYQVFARSGLRDLPKVQRVIVEAARPCWDRGHPLLRAIAHTISPWRGARWSITTTREVFGTGYYVRSTTEDPALRLSYERLETEWKSAGRVCLPTYFQQFGVLSVEQFFKRLQQAALEEAKRQAHRLPSPAEITSITLLANCLRELAPALMGLFESGKTFYSVAETEVLLGQLKQERGYRSREVFVSAQLFVADFPEALAVFLHEHTHIFGYDGSRGFTDALTELLEAVVRHRTYLDLYDTQWEEACRNVRVERGATRPEAPIAKQLATKTAAELRELLLKLPPTVVHALLDPIPQ